MNIPEEKTTQEQADAIAKAQLMAMFGEDFESARKIIEENKNKDEEEKDEEE